MIINLKGVEKFKKIEETIRNRFFFFTAMAVVLKFKRLSTNIHIKKKLKIFFCLKIRLSI